MGWVCFSDPEDEKSLITLLAWTRKYLCLSNSQVFKLGQFWGYLQNGMCMIAKC